MRRISSMGVGLALTLTAAAVDAAQEEDVDLRSRFAECRDAMQDGRMDVIRDKVQLLGQKDFVFAPPRKPSAEEAEALRLLHAAQVKCSMAIAQRAHAAKLDSPLMLDEFAHEQLSGLVLLMNGYTTYADFDRWRRARTEKAVQDAKRKAQEEAAKRDRPKR